MNFIEFPLAERTSNVCIAVERISAIQPKRKNCTILRLHDGTIFEIALDYRIVIDLLKKNFNMFLIQRANYYHLIENPT